MHSLKRSSLGPKPLGFTLIEILIALAILVFISVAIYQTTTQTYQLKNKLRFESDFYNSLTLGITLIRNDIQNLYTPTAWLNLSLKPNDLNRMDERRDSTYWSAPPDTKRGVSPSRLIGTENEMSFISVSNRRIYKNSHTTPFMKVNYLLKEDQDTLLEGDQKTALLIRVTNANAFSQEERQDFWVQKRTLLKGVKSLRYKYYQRDGRTWKVFKTWDSALQVPRYRLPDKIEMELELQGQGALAFEGNFFLKPEMLTDEIPSVF